MKIKLHNDFRGSITDERYYLAGEYEVGGVMPLTHAKALVDDGRGDWVTEPMPDPKPPAEVKRKATRRSRKAGK